MGVVDPYLITNWTVSCYYVVFSGDASPTIWSCYANFQSLSSYISLEINRFRGYKDGIQ